MPTLTWNGKHLSSLRPATFALDSIVFPGGNSPRKASPRNHIYLGENFTIMSALLPKYEGSIDLIYVDPPFYTNKKYSARIGRGEDSRKPSEWLTAEGYHDHWAALDDYLEFLYDRLSLMHKLLSPTGTLYLHLDWHADSYARLLLDEIFGAERLLNVIAWVYHGPSPIKKAFNRKHDTILVYTKGEQYTFNVDAVRVPYDESTVKTFASSPKAGFGKIPDLQRGKVPEDWWYFPVVARLHNERTGYPTQKPESLLKRILLASSNPGDLVADFFCGSGTTAAAAAQTGRSFIASDESLRAIQTTRSRLVQLPSAPFSVSVSDQTEITYENPGREILVTLAHGKMTVTGNLDELDYWEADPDWDGKIFRSMVQAARPVRSADIVKSLEIKTGRSVCVRLAMATGNQYQVVLNV